MDASSFFGEPTPQGESMNAAGQMYSQQPSNHPQPPYQTNGQVYSTGPMSQQPQNVQGHQQSQQYQPPGQGHQQQPQQNHGYSQGYSSMVSQY